MFTMDIFLIIFGIIAVCSVLALITAYICFHMCFRVSKKEREEYKNTEFPLPVGEIYEPYYEKMIGWIKDLSTLPHDDVEIKSFDGLTLRGKYYEYAPDAPMEILFHGYRGSSKRDLCGGVSRCFRLGHSALIVDHRGHGESEGKVITFGAKESRDAVRWVDYAAKRFGKERKIILTGISMGAATVMITASKDLPENVIGVLADCGYTSAKEVISKVMREDMRLPPALLYPFVKLGAKIYGRFDIDEASPIESMKKCKLPVIFIHGDNDLFVPWDMSRRNYEACTSEKKLFVTIEGAGHGTAYAINHEKYLSSLKEFFAPFV